MKLEDRMSETKPLTMTAEREAELRGCWTSDPFLVELDAERAAHSQTIQAAEKLAEALEPTAGALLHCGCADCQRNIKLRNAALAQWEAVRRGK